MKEKETLNEQEQQPELELEQQNMQSESLPQENDQVSTQSHQKQELLTTPQNKTQVAKQTKAKKSVQEKFAVLFFVLGFFAVLIGFLPLVSAFIIIGYYFILIIAAILTLFTLLLNEDFRNLLSKGGEAMEFVSKLIPYSPYVLGGAIPLLITSIVLFALTKNKSSKIAGIIFSSLIFPLFIAISTKSVM